MVRYWWVYVYVRKRVMTGERDKIEADEVLVDPIPGQKSSVHTFNNIKPSDWNKCIRNYLAVRSKGLNLDGLYKYWVPPVAADTKPSAL
jgi:hypothetical protein